MRKGALAGLVGLLVLAPTVALAQAAPDLTYAPTSGPIGTTITVDGSCPFPEGDVDNNAGDAVALYRVSDGALVDVDVQLGNPSGTEPPSETWTTTLTVEPTLETASDPSEATTPGAYELALFCDIGSSFRGPGGSSGSGGPTQPSGADVRKPFEVTTTTTTTAPTTTTTAPTTTTTAPNTTTTAPTTTTTTALVPPADGHGDTFSGATVSDSSVPPGAVVTVAGAGFAADAPLNLTLFSHPLPLGSTRSDGAGNYEATVRIPLAATPGAHQIVVTGPNSLGGGHRSVAALTVEDVDCSDLRTQPDAQAVLDAHAGDPHRLDGDDDGVACETRPGRGGSAVTATKSGALPRTGTSVGDYLAGAILTIGLGMGLVLLARSRARRS